MRKLKPGCLYLVSFYDHYIGDSDSMDILMAGFYIGENKDFLFFTNWMPMDDDVEVRESNYEKVSIIKSAIKKIKKLTTFNGTKPVF